MEKREKISFTQLVKKAKKDKAKLLDSFITKSEVIDYLEAETKIINKSLIAGEYLELQTRINNIQETIVTDENAKEIVDNLNKLGLEQEINRCFKILNLYVNGVFFDTELDILHKKEEYDLLFGSGIYGYILSFCEEDIAYFNSMIDRDIATGMNTIATLTLKELVKNLMSTIDIKALEGLKDEMEKAMQTQGFKELVSISEKIK